VVDFVTPFRTTTHQLLDDPTYLMSVLEKGAEQAREVAVRTLADVYERVGFVAPPAR
jgi:tryptophanyl-tRNA synthetase